MAFQRPAGFEVARFAYLMQPPLEVQVAGATFSEQELAAASLDNKMPAVAALSLPPDFTDLSHHSISESRKRDLSVVLPELALLSVLETTAGAEACYPLEEEASHQNVDTPSANRSKSSSKKTRY